MSTGMEETPNPAAADHSGEEDDDPPLLSSYALQALREFLSEQSSLSQADGVGGRDDSEEVRLVSEDWRLSQFWYDRETAEALVEEIRVLHRMTSSPVVCIACPTLYAYLKKLDPSIPAMLLEYDKRFEQYGCDFTFYDYNQPEDLPSSLKHAYQIVVADPPYLSRECLEKVAQTISFLAHPQGSYLLLLTGEVQKERAAELLKAHPCGFRPQHSNKLGNEFQLFTNYDPAERLGGWQKNAASRSSPFPAILFRIRQCFQYDGEDDESGGGDSQRGGGGDGGDGGAYVDRGVGLRRDNGVLRRGVQLPARHPSHARYRHRQARPGAGAPLRRARRGLLREVSRGVEHTCCFSLLRSPGGRFSLTCAANYVLVVRLDCVDFYL
ncbi:protein-lysine N-methyltransferase N6AMT2 [Canna indica]|uniref:Protein-lysine N-methyltransferase Cni_G11828 n=1 Tax=Canna indica TaxID=4628 RepID=A0AAQ3K6Q7_9LILI|nr:protein-lysine N-methyltransferase N6AMT2 [Canna indica]